jgi:hypothetical protein
MATTKRVRFTDEVILNDELKHLKTKEERLLRELGYGSREEWKKSRIETTPGKGETKLEKQTPVQCDIRTFFTLTNKVDYHEDNANNT